jgi:hypothetical protein
MSEGGFTLSFARGDSNDLSILLSFPGQKAPQYPLGRYPLAAEFRAMVAALDPETPMPDWKGKYFFGFRIERGKETEFSFRARDNGITFTLSAKEWKAVRKLFRRAWEIPDVRLAWDALVLEYG